MSSDSSPSSPSTKTKTKTKTTTLPLKTFEKVAFELARKDVEAERNEYFFKAPKWLCKWFNINPKELPLFYCLYNVLILGLINYMMLPWLYYAPWYILAIISGIRIALCGSRFILGLHFATHNPIIQPEWLNRFFLEYILCPLMGIPCGCYKNHHIVMHHKENNIHPLDLSSTMPYRRDNIWHFLFYWLRFEIGVWVELPYWMIVKRYYSTLIQFLFSEAIWFSMIYIWWQIRPAFSLWLLLIPQIVVSFLLMFGNFSQHIFVDRKEYDNDHKLTINLLHTPYNQLTFNDGYHILHHKYPNLHWTELPGRFATMRELKSHAESDAICFDNVDYFIMGVLVMSGYIKKLAEKMIPINEKQANMTLAEKVAFLEERLQPIPSPQSPNFDPLFGLFRYFFNP